ncbi:hypothetical protein, partial [Escherichia coli]|uniref:hypothetical protein n=1 Tax=Escherichia coli TaxID=562 RepID=UPI0021B5E0BB
VGSTHHLEMVFVWKQNYILVDEYFFFCCTWIVNSARKQLPLGLLIPRNKTPCFACRWLATDDSPAKTFV